MLRTHSITNEMAAEIFWRSSPRLEDRRMGQGE